MIIEAGYDILELLGLPWMDFEEPRRPLWLIALDSDLRLAYRRRVLDDFDGHTAAHVDQILAELDSEHVRYFFIAHAVEMLKKNSDEERYRDDEELRQRSRDAGFELLGHIVFDPEYWASSGPMYRFSDYALDELPRSMTVRGPHPYLDCPCVICAEERKRHQSIIAALPSRHEDDVDA